MSKLASSLLTALITLAGLAHSSRPVAHANAARGDEGSLRQASLMLRHTSRSHVLRWLRRQPNVAQARLARDNVTIDITFRDGLQSVIFGAQPRFNSSISARWHNSERLSGFPRDLGATWSRTEASSYRASSGSISVEQGEERPRPPSRLQTVALRPRLAPTGSDPSAVPRRALVLEPFATELQLGPHAGDAIADELRSAGFTVDQLYDQDVTVQSMENLWKYDVVYMDTHSGVNQYGEGVVGTGQQANDDPAMDPYIKDGTVIVGSVAGTDQLYYGILSAFIVQHEQPFDPGSLAFINGCTLLLGTAFWQALRYQGVGAMISWYDDVAPPSASVAAQLVFEDLIRHRTVSDAVGDAPRQGYELINGTGGPAHIGYLGDGSLTLWPDSVPPTPTVTPALSPTAIPSPTDTPTPTVPVTSVAGPRATSTTAPGWSCTYGRFRRPARCP